MSLKEILSLHRDLGTWYGAALKKILHSQRLKPEVIANHGQTVAHFPSLKGQGMTLQLGDATRIAVATRRTVIAHFREGDLAAGGQGAPLAPFFHKLLAQTFGKAQKGIAIHNLGGISNLTYLGPKKTFLAFDTGPASVWIDAATELASKGKMKFDRGGALAKQGVVDTQCVQQVLKHPYFSACLPKSTGRDDFPLNYFLSRTHATGTDLISTATQITVESIAQAYETWILGKKLPLSKVYFCGGGAQNLTLMNRLRTRLPKISWSTLAEEGVDPQTVEAQAFALFGFCSLFGLPVGGPWTSVPEFGPPGHIIPGENWDGILKKLSLFKKNAPIFRQIQSLR